MSTFDTYTDSPNQIKNEGQNISLKFERTSDTTGRISWNIPSPSAGCASGNQAYNGIIITLDTSHTNPDKTPINGTVYEADNVIDKDLHVGDSINSSLVIGSFYNDKTTTFMDISSLLPNESYYISGFAVDLQNRYHTSGVHAYSLDVSNTTKTDDTAGCQQIKISNSDIILTDPTNLLAQSYDFEITSDVENLTSKIGDNGIISAYTYIPSNQYQSELTYTNITIDGSVVGTYQLLLDEINYQLKKIDNPFESNIPPNTNQYYWNSVESKLYQWDGYEHVLQDIIFEPTDPVIRAIGDYWFDQSLLKTWDGSQWNNVPYIEYYKDPSILDCTDYWFDGSTIFNWDGNVWTTPTAQIIQQDDPNNAPILDCGTFWFNSDSTSLLLNKLSVTNTWVTSNVIYWHEPLNSLSVNTLWYKSDTSELFEWTGLIWNNIPIVQDEPVSPILNQYWFDSINNIISTWNGSQWNSIPFIDNLMDPTDPISNGVFWNSVSDLLYVWDITTSSWDLVNNFIQSDIDPLDAPIIETNSVWINGNQYSVWDGVQWNEINVIEWNTDPSIRSNGDIAFFANQWNIWNGSWSIFEVIESLIEPTSGTLPLNTIWLNSTNTTLQLWNGLSWIQVAFSNTPLTPVNGTLWLDTNTSELKKWYKSAWMIENAKIIASYIDGNIKFCSVTKGHRSNVVVNQISDNLFKFIYPDVVFGTIQEGTDGLSDLPLYQQHGVGTDGNNDVRKELSTTLMQQLGYPTVEVEISKAQLDIAIDSGIEEIRKRTGIGYKRGYFFLDLNPGQQRYMMTNKGNGFNKIVEVMGIHRTTSSFLAGFDNGVFGQSAINFLYSAQGYDLVSYHLYSSYVEELETLFATRIMYQFNEQARTLDIFQAGYRHERVLMDVSVERTEQDLMQDRRLRSWIEGWAMSQCMIILSQIRGKYGSLPGANGISLNAADLYAQAQDIMTRLLIEIDEFVVEDPNEWGMGGAGLVLG